MACFLLFNIMDWAGRSLTAVCMWVSNGRAPPTAAAIASRSDAQICIFEAMLRPLGRFWNRFWNRF